MDNIHNAFDANFSSLDNLEYYKEWSNTYNQDVKDCNYTGPKNIIKILNRYLDLNRKYKIADFGCGTGLVGKLLKNGNVILDGYDLSQKMLNKCDVNIYNDLLQFDFNKVYTNNLVDYLYDFILCCGTFTHGHVKIENIVKMFTYLKKME